MARMSELTPPTAAPTADRVTAGREALARHAWQEAFEELSRGMDYSGTAVHVAARVAGLASGGEILATTQTLAEAPDVATSDPRSASIKGVTAPVSVAPIAWS
jgi:class 3 adenylate cyclase